MSRVYKRSRSSPPSSRRSTLDSVKSEDLMMACCEMDEEQAPNDEPLIVEMLETQAPILPDQLLDQSQTHPNALLVIVERQGSEIEGLKSQLTVARNDVASAENKLARLRQQQLEGLQATTQKTEQHRSNSTEEPDRMNKARGREKGVLERKLLETETILRETTDRCKMLTEELTASHETLEQLQAENRALSDKLSQGIEENERLYNRVRDLEEKSGLSSSRDRGRSFDSLSDLTNIELDLHLSTLDKERILEEYDELRSRFEKAILEIRTMRKELREAHTLQDALELEIFAYEQGAVSMSESNQAQAQLMAVRIQDLTNKLASSEKQVRILKQKLTKVETRDKRRSLSLKGRESFQTSQDMEEKLLELEAKIRAIERGKSSQLTCTSSKEHNSGLEIEEKRGSKQLDYSGLRRKSLDSATSSEPMQVLIRLSSLEAKVAENIASDVNKNSTECSEVGGDCSTTEESFELLTWLRKLEEVVSKSKRRLETFLGVTQAEGKTENCLRKINDNADSCTQCRKSQATSQATESEGILATDFQSMLKQKLKELTERWQSFRHAGLLEEREKMSFILERLAIEVVILRQIRCATGEGVEKNAVLAELVKTSQIASNLKRKIRGTKPKSYQNTSYDEYLTKLLASKLALLSVVEATSTMQASAAREEALEFLLRKQREVDEVTRRFKETRLGELAEALAIKTLSLSELEEASCKKIPKDKRVREAWQVAQETMNRELVQAEVFHVMMQCGQIYEQGLTSILDTWLSLDTSCYVTVENWVAGVQTRLRQELENSMRELSNAYKDSLRLLKRSRISGLRPHDDSRRLLTDYADVMAHKAFIDARISLLRENTISRCSVLPHETFVSSLIRNEEVFSYLLDENFEHQSVLGAEYSCLYQQFTKEYEEKLSGSTSKEHVKNLGQSLLLLEEELQDLSKLMREKFSEESEDPFWSRCTILSNDWPAVYELCSQLRKHVRRISAYLREYRCRNCIQLQETIRKIVMRHQEKLKGLKRNQERELMEIKEKLDNQKRSLASQYEHEAAALRERARKLEDRLNAMDSEHSAHINELRATYEKSISAELDTDAETRKRYKKEIKELRALCEKSLLAMENSHKRVIAEMEEKHRQELEGLRVEKQQALSEETQATLAALDAMRKAHEHEVQKEIAKFKQEFIKQVHTREDFGMLHKEQEYVASHGRDIF